ncbi:helix-turn-helix domain-containing protein [Microbacterium sp. NPDC058062]|uniref:helix-turn-helix domain-containing protein n=1 Tax=Microbacterium sp. NPDC058062 TaxID=3346320 RepID=UPI0036DA42D6
MPTPSEHVERPASNRPAKRGYSVKEAAQYLGLSEWVLRDEMRNNRIAAKKRGTTVLFDIAELDRYFDDLPERIGEGSSWIEQQERWRQQRGR